MGIDLEAIRRKVQELQSGRSQSRVNLWKPNLGKHKVRVLPWPANVLKDGQPFVERWFYYIGENRGFLSPFQFDKEDPVAELRKKLYSVGDPESRDLAKKLQPKMRCYLPLIERGRESDGVMVWSFGKGVYQRLLGFFLLDDIDDWTDPQGGFDLDVAITKIEGKKYNDTTVDLARRPSPLAGSDDEIQKLLSSIPDINDLYRQKSTEEINRMLDAWLNDDVELDQSEGTSRGDSGVDALDELLSEVKGEAKEKKAEPEEKSKKSVKKAMKKEKDSSEDSTSEKSLDAAFADLMGSDD